MCPNSLNPLRLLCPVFLVLAFTMHCQAQNTVNFPAIGHVDRFEDSLDQLLDADAKIEVLCGGFEWSEGPCLGS